MSADIERGFIAAVLYEKRIVDAVEAGITGDFFSPDGDKIVKGKPVLSMNGRVWEWCLDHWRKHGAAPSPERLSREFPAYKLSEPTDTFSSYVHELRRRWSLDRASVAISDSLECIDAGDPDKVAMLFEAAARDIAKSTSASWDIDLTEGAVERVKRRYLDYRDPQALRGVPFGFDKFDMMTKGARRKQLITLAGREKSYKSFTLLHMFRSAFTHGVRPMLVGFEMTNDEQEERLLADMANLPYAAVQAGTLNKAQRTKLNRAARTLEAHQPILLSTDIESGMTVSGLAAKIDQHKPRILFVDGVYMMEDETGEPKGTPRALTNITRSLKRLAQRQDIPIVITTQALGWKSRKGVTGDSIGYTSSFVQDSDLVMVTERDPEAKDPSFKLKCVLARSCPTFETTIMWDWETTTMIELGDADARISDDEEV